MKKYLLSTFAVLTALTVGTAANAGVNPADHMYVRADAGWAIGMKNTEDAALFDIGVGARLNDYLRADITGEFRPWGKTKFKKTADNAKPDMWAMDAMANIYASYPVGRAFSLYATGGVGYAYTKTDSWRGVYKGKGKSNFAWNAGAGVEYALTDCLTLDFGYRYTDLGNARLEDRQTGVKLKEDVHYSDIKVGVQYYF